MNSQGVGHNSVDNPMLLSFMERLEDRERDKRAAAEDIKDLCAEAKGQGLDPKALKALVREKLMTESERAKRDEHEAIMDLYRRAVGRA